VAEVLLFHHAAGHVVHAPDLYEGKTFAQLSDGVGHAEQVGFDTIIRRGRLAAEGLPNGLVYAGFSLGVMPAQMMAQTRPGAKGALLLHAAVPIAEFGGPWPQGVPLQIHTMEADAWGDTDVARDLAATIEGAELFLYPGDRHLFSDNSLPDYDENAAVLLEQRVLSFLDNIE
jgi:dienelactone hydrolase